MSKIAKTAKQIIASQNLIASQRKHGILIIPSPATLAEIERQEGEGTVGIAKQLRAATRTIPFRLQDWYKPGVPPPYPAYTKRDSADVTLADLAPTLRLAVKKNKTLSTLYDAFNKQAANRDKRRATMMLKEHASLVSETDDLHCLILMRDDLLNQVKERADEDTRSVIANLYPASKLITTAILELEFRHAMQRLGELERVAKQSPQHLIGSPDMASEICALQDWISQYQREQGAQGELLRFYHAIEHAQELVLRERIEQDLCAIPRTTQPQQTMGAA